VDLSLSFSDARFERSSPSDKYDLLLGVVATFVASVDGRTLYMEEGLPIVELQDQLARWSVDGIAGSEDFAYDSLEAEEPGLLWFRHDVEGGWRVGSLFQDYIEMTVWSDAEVREVVTRFVENVDQWVESNLRVRVTDVIPR